MDIFSPLLVICEGYQPVIGEYIYNPKGYTKKLYHVKSESIFPWSYPPQSSPYGRRGVYRLVPQEFIIHVSRWRSLNSELNRVSTSSWDLLNNAVIYAEQGQLTRRLGREVETKTIFRFLPQNNEFDRVILEIANPCDSDYTRPMCS